MSIVTFACTQCHTVDIDTSIDSSATLCTSCSTGQWHGLFEQETFDPMKHTVNNEESNSDLCDLGVPSFS